MAWRWMISVLVREDQDYYKTSRTLEGGQKTLNAPFLGDVLLCAHTMK
jgi:hypothetical protein